MSYIPNTVHFSKRAYDKKFEIVALADVNGERRWITIDVCDDHKTAVETVRKRRGTTK
tara:strand:+ start:75 stop:248 length:174 start_codon:yes stop_codon:yes gene_type:complete